MNEAYYKQGWMVFRHIWLDYQQGMGNSLGDYLIPPWHMNRNRYVIDDFGNVVKFLSYPVSPGPSPSEQRALDRVKEEARAELRAAQERLRKLQASKKQGVKG